MKILTYNLAGHPAHDQVLSIAALKGIEIHPVSPADFQRPLSDLLRPDYRPDRKADVVPAFTDTMLLFSTVSMEELSDYLDALKAVNAPPVELKAMATATNMYWTSVQLHDELLKEHRYYHPEEEK